MIEFCHGLELDLFGIDGGVRFGVGLGVGLKVGFGLECGVRVGVGRGHGLRGRVGVRVGLGQDLIRLRIEGEDKYGARGRTRTRCRESD